MISCSRSSLSRTLSRTLSRLSSSSFRLTRRSLLPTGVACALILAGTVTLSGAKPAAAGRVASLSPKLSASYGKLPLSFEPNLGQTDEQVKFISRGAGYTLFLTPTEAVFSLLQGDAAKNVSAADLLNPTPSAKQAPDAVLRVQLATPNRTAAIVGMEQLPGKTNYIRGNDPAKWQANIPTFAKLHYSEAFPGVDLVYYGNQGQLEYDFVVAAGADPNGIGLTFSGARGLRVDRESGDLVMKVGRKEVRFHKPVAYQSESSEAAAVAGGQRNFVAAQYRLESHNRVSFALGSYDRSRQLVIDPTLSYSTYLGGSSNDYATAIAVDGSGNAYVTGYTNSANFPVTSGAFQTSCGGGCSGTTEDAFVSKLDPTGSFLVYSTYLGGSANDLGNGIALDAAGDAYVVGQTFSSDFPITHGAFQTQCGGSSCSGGDGFIAKLTPDGSALVYSTYLGGTGINQANAIALDPSNNAYVTGYTQSLSFPVTPGGYQTSCKCSVHSVAFVTKLNSSGSALVYSTYLGGTNSDVAYSIALDSANNAYLTGYTHSTNFPTTAGAFQTKLTADTGAWVTKMNSIGNALVYSTYLGGNTTNTTTQCEACATAITVDSSGSAYVCGLTAESNFPVTPGAFQLTFMSSSSGHDAFITKFNPSGSALDFSTYAGGTGDDGATGIKLDGSGNVWFKGNTKSTDFPITPGAYQPASAGIYDAFVSELDPTGKILLYSTYLGGSGTEYGGATAVLAVDGQVPPNVYVVGYTNSTNFPVTAGSLQTSNAGANDGFVSKFAPSPNVGVSAGLNFGYESDGTKSAPQNITVTNTGNSNLIVSAVNITGTNSTDFAETNNCSTVAAQSTCTITVTFTPSIVGTENASVSITDNAPASPQLVSLTGYGLGDGPAVVFTPTSLTFADQLVGTVSAAQPITMSNVGNQSMSITKIVVTGNFLQTNNCGKNLAAGTNCTIMVSFKPLRPNILTGTVQISDNASGSPQSVALTGYGTYIVLSPTSLNFGTVTVGKSSAPQTVTFTNTANFAVTMKGISIIGTNSGDYSQTNTCGSTVAVGGSCTVTVTFKPTTTGIRTASLSIADGGGGSPQLVPLSGMGQ